MCLTPALGVFLLLDAGAKRFPVLRVTARTQTRPAEPRKPQPHAFYLFYLSAATL